MFLVRYVVPVWLLDDNWMVIFWCCAADAESVSRSLLFFKCFVLYMKPLTGIPVYESVKYEMLHSQNIMGLGIFFVFNILFFNFFL